MVMKVHCLGERLLTMLKSKEIATPKGAHIIYYPLQPKEWGNETHRVKSHIQYEHELGGKYKEKVSSCILSDCSEKNRNPEACILRPRYDE